MTLILPAFELSELLFRGSVIFSKSTIKSAGYAGCRVVEMLNSHSKKGRQDLTSNFLATLPPPTLKFVSSSYSFSSLPSSFSISSSCAKLSLPVLETDSNAIRFAPMGTKFAPLKLCLPLFTARLRILDSDFFMLF